MEDTKVLMKSVLEGIEEWRFIPDVTPLSGYAGPWITVLLYFVLLRVLQRIMSTRKPFEFPTILFVHNILLSIGSAVLWIALAYVIFEKSWISGGPYGLHQMVCSESMHNDGRLQVIYYINYFFKYYELIDTILLVLRCKPVPFLHEYHHAATLILTWSQQREHSTVQWVPIILNLFVHILMYYYYAMSALKIRVWWKQYLTTIQIMQFVIDVIACAYAYSIFILAGMNYSACYGTQIGAITGILILASYLLLFVRFYLVTYKTPASKSDAVKQKKTS
uniref:Elongation of fatty acids protein n=1 Tax=Timspurckia oligopyrenoides TaxID=708627 RepID=A0A6T6P560_9RHOD|mmetsp:Transcript_9947/g.17914  ORF Transcript_9947/g.17914 Transcript_9947/m.17914 type:complete len:278 (+) Transcript_9947:41-874(+)